MHPFDFHSPQECRLLADWYERLASLEPPEGIAPWGWYHPIAAESSDSLWMLGSRLPGEQTCPRSVFLASWRVL